MQRLGEDELTRLAECQLVYCPICGRLMDCDRIDDTVGHYVCDGPHSDHVLRLKVALLPDEETEADRRYHGAVDDAVMGRRYV